MNLSRIDFVMKPCPKNQPLIVWMTLGTLNPEETRQLRVHLDGCPGCAQYLQEVAAICRDHERAAEVLTDTQANSSFHERLRSRIEADAARPAFARAITAFFRQLPRLTMPQAAAAGAVLVIGLLCLWKAIPRENAAPKYAVHPPAVAVPKVAATPPPTLATYRMVANTSPEALDELLNRQADRESSRHRQMVFSISSRSEMEN
jgi:anti-sigma factor RsiW